MKTLPVESKELVLVGINHCGSSGTRRLKLSCCATLAILLLTVSCLVCPAGATDTLHRRTVKSESGKDLLMDFRELSRDKKTSTAKVTVDSGTSVASAMFVARGFYDIARARGAKYFIKLKEWRAEDGSWMYLVGFASDKDVKPEEYFGLPEPLPDSREYRLLSVEEFDIFFKDAQ